MSIVSLSTCARCSEGDVESSEVSTVETGEGADDERDSAGDCTPSSEVSTVETGEGADDERDSAGDCTPSSESVTVETDDGADDERDSAVDWTPSNESVTVETDDGSEDDGVRRTVGDMMTEDSTRVTGDALGEVAKIPSTSIFSSLSRTASS